MNTSLRKNIEMRVINEKVVICTPLSKNGKEAKSVTMSRFIELDDLFFEGLGLWVGEGGKSKGPYFGNSCPELLSHFLKFAEEKPGIDRKNFKVTSNVLALNDGNSTKKKMVRNIANPGRKFYEDVRRSQNFA